MIYEWFLIFVLSSTPAGDEIADNGWYVLEKVQTKAHCKKMKEVYEEVWPVVSTYGSYACMYQEQPI